MDDNARDKAGDVADKPVVDVNAPYGVDARGKPYKNPPEVREALRIKQQLARQAKAAKLKKSAAAQKDLFDEEISKELDDKYKKSSSNKKKKIKKEKSSSSSSKSDSEEENPKLRFEIVTDIKNGREFIDSLTYPSHIPEDEVLLKLIHLLTRRAQRKGFLKREPEKKEEEKAQIEIWINPQTKKRRGYRFDDKIFPEEADFEEWMAQYSISTYANSQHIQKRKEEWASRSSQSAKNSQASMDSTDDVFAPPLKKKKQTFENKLESPTTKSIVIETEQKPIEGGEYGDSQQKMVEENAEPELEHLNDYVQLPDAQKDVNLVESKINNNNDNDVVVVVSQQTKEVKSGATERKPEEEVNNEQQPKVVVTRKRKTSSNIDVSLEAVSRRTRKNFDKKFAVEIEKQKQQSLLSRRKKQKTGL